VILQGRRAILGDERLADRAGGVGIRDATLVPTGELRHVHAIQIHPVIRIHLVVNRGPCIGVRGAEIRDIALRIARRIHMKYENLGEVFALRVLSDLLEEGVHAIIQEIVISRVLRERGGCERSVSLIAELLDLVAICRGHIPSGVGRELSVCVTKMALALLVRLVVHQHRIQNVPPGRRHIGAV